MALAPEAAEEEELVEPPLPASVSLALDLVLSAEAVTPVEFVQCELYSELVRAVEVKVTSVHCLMVGQPKVLRIQITCKIEWLTSGRG